MEEIRFVDSSGWGELVSAYTTIRAHGGKLAMMHISGKPLEHLQITKLLTVFEVYENEAEALSGFLPARYAQCPVCSHSAYPPIRSGDVDWKPQQCRCGARFFVEAIEDKESVVAVRRVRISTYFDEFFEILSGPPITIAIVGRLDKFSSSAFKRLERVLSEGQNVLFDLSKTSQADAEGRRALISFIRDSEQRFRAVVSLEGLNEHDSLPFAQEDACFSPQSRALEELGEVSEKVWTTKVSRELM